MRKKEKTLETEVSKVFCKYYRFQPMCSKNFQTVFSCAKFGIQPINSITASLKASGSSMNIMWAVSKILS